MAKKLYCVIIGDINHSRLLTKRNDVQKSFQNTLRIVNKEFADEIQSKLILTLGDEFQGLLRSARESYSLIQRLSELMEPVAFSFGVGIGTISTPVKDVVTRMDGEAFHRARTALAQAKKTKRVIVFNVEHDFLSLVNALVALMERRWTTLTPRQQEIARLMRTQTQQRVAKRLRISQQAISKARASAAINELEQAEQALREFIGSLR